MKKSIDRVGFDEDGRFDLEGFVGDIFERIKALVVVIADDNSETSENDRYALTQLLQEEVLEVERYLKKWVDEDCELWRQRHKVDSQTPSQAAD